jgi:hypothetical protein
MSKCVLAGVVLAVSALPLAASAEDLTEKTHVHVFGGWAYGRTDGNQYLAGVKGGSYDTASLALNVTSDVSDKLRIVGQAEWVDGSEGSEIQFDYAFAEWRLSPNVKLRAGKVKQPFGLSAEVFDVGTLRPFYELPQATYGGIGLVGESYKGVGLSGYVGLKHGWGLNYDVYGGGQELEEYRPPEALLLGETFQNPIETERTKDMVGGRVIVDTPVEGLRFGTSAYTGTEIGATRRTGFGVQGEYLTGKWSLRSEYMRETAKNDLSADGFYAEAAFHFDRHWQAAAQYGRLTSELAAVPTPVTPSLLRHEEFAFGLNYWWSPNFVFKASYHHVNGNRLAGPLPEDLGAVVAEGSLDKRTNLVIVGAQFSF